MRTLMLLWLVLGVIQSLDAQPRGRQLKVGFGMNGIAYLGDFTNPEVMTQRIYPGANISLQVEGPMRLKLQLNSGFGKFADQFDGVIPVSSPEIEPNHFVETSFFYSDLRLKYRFPISRWIHPYLTAGAGILVFSPKDQNGRFLSDAEFTREAGENYSTAIPQIPFGLGIQSRINKTVSLSLEYLYRYTPTDYLDNVGRLGPRKGPDALHGVQLSLYITLSPPEDPVYTEVRSPASETIIEPEVQQEAPPEVQPEYADGPAISDAQLSESTDGSPTPYLYQQIDWDVKIQEAIDEKRFILHKVKKGESLDQIAEKYHVGKDILVEINFLQSESLHKGQSLMIPDIGKKTD